MDRIDFSVVATVLNEEKSIIPLLDSLASQTLQPNEVLVVDAGSKDRTKNLIATWKKDHPTFPMELLSEPGVNRSTGRNLAIQKARNEHIAVTDAGCVAEKHWLERLGEGFLEGTEAVAGYYLTKTHSTLAQIYSYYMAVLPEDFNARDFLPSSRSIAFTKEAWEAAGTYPEHLETCEDLLFAATMKEKVSMSVKQNALVYWHTEMGVQGFFSKMEGYARGDILANYTPHVRKIWTVFLRYALFIGLPPLFLAYLFYPLYKFREKIDSLQTAFLLPPVQLIADMAVMSGSVKGYVGKIFG